MPIINTTSQLLTASNKLVIQYTHSTARKALSLRQVIATQLDEAAIQNVLAGNSALIIEENTQDISENRIYWIFAHQNNRSLLVGIGITDTQKYIADHHISRFKSIRQALSPKSMPKLQAKESNKQRKSSSAATSIVEAKFSKFCYRNKDLRQTQNTRAMWHSPKASMPKHKCCLQVTAAITDIPGGNDALANSLKFVASNVSDIEKQRAIQALIDAYDHGNIIKYSFSTHSSQPCAPYFYDTLDTHALNNIFNPNYVFLIEQNIQFDHSSQNIYWFFQAGKNADVCIGLGRSDTKKHINSYCESMHLSIRLIDPLYHYLNPYLDPALSQHFRATLRSLVHRGVSIANAHFQPFTNPLAPSLDPEFLGKIIRQRHPQPVETHQPSILSLPGQVRKDGGPYGFMGRKIHQATN